ncbi:Aldo/keto reductase [Russula ochroleuca]|jgi:L-glyceraldehyde reductase|uniref:Aldo/keto reductase n=1 Tax=Russula ochroleuca TaxID=152965 RepID=A0A9P5N1N7_9AGAM|nr:Aldo/keto reductase [Russula ochroleuca]
MSLRKTLQLQNGIAIPQIGLGTWLSKPHEVENSVVWAVEAGYRHLDCAYVYENQDEVGAALKKVIPSVIRREELFITSKLWNNAHHPSEVEKQLDITLSQLGTPYLDLYLIHWPVAFVSGREKIPVRADKPDVAEIDVNTSLVDTWNAMIALRETGKVKAIGVSNFTIQHLEAIIKATGERPTVNQIEAHPLLPQDDMVEYCRKQEIHITAYSPLGNNLQGKRKLVDYPEVKEVADRLGVTTAQVLIAWGVSRGYSVIPKSVQKDRIIKNFEQVTLSKEDYEKISEIGKNNHVRFNIPVTYSPKWMINLFDEAVEKETQTEYVVKLE